MSKGKQSQEYPFNPFLAQENEMRVHKRPIFGAMGCLSVAMFFSTVCVNAQEQGNFPPSRYMGGPAELVTAPNGAIANAEILEATPQIMYLEPTTDEVAEGSGAWGGYSAANTTVIEAEDGLIVYDTGDNNDEAEHIREAIEKISDKSIKVIIYSHSH